MPWFTSTRCFHPRANIQFASDARRDRAEILIGPFGLAYTRGKVAKGKGKNNQFADCSRSLFAFSDHRVRDFARVESSLIESHVQFVIDLVSINALDIFNLHKVSFFQLKGTLRKL